jgi:hypothetical protein
MRHSDYFYSQGGTNMLNRHPFRWINEAYQKRVFWFLFVFTILIIAGLQYAGGPLTTSSAPSGIVSFEFAYTLSNAQAMIDSWGAEGQVYAGINLGLDYLFMVSYGLTIGLGCALVARGMAGWVKSLPSVGIVLAWGALLAALLDALENYALMRLLLGSTNVVWAIVAYWCAWPKFVLVGLGLLYVILGSLISFIARRGNK